MKKMLENKIVQIGITAFFVIAACILFGFCLFHVSYIFGFLKTLVRILMPLIYGLVLAYIMHPLVNLFEHKVFNKITKNTTNRTVIPIRRNLPGVRPKICSISCSRISILPISSFSISYT